MHEYSIVQSLYDSVMTHAAARGIGTVQQVRVRIGELSGVDVGLLDTAWRTFRVRTPCEAAEMLVDVVPARWECPACHTRPARSTGAPSCFPKGEAATPAAHMITDAVMEVLPM